jgi:formylglycine-generating enzyme
MTRLPLLIGTLLIAGCNAAVGDPPTESSAIVCGLESSAIGKFVAVPAGQFRKGAHAVYPEESPEIVLHVDAFEMLAHEVTNGEFTRFVEATRYVTLAERSDSGEGAGSAVFRMPAERTNPAEVWQLVRGATWRTPEGPGSSLDGRGLEPVVHVALEDVEAYAAWAGGRLPTEEEWEYAAAIGLPDPAVATSGAYGPDGAPRANTWQGIFPLANAGDDGFIGRAPVGCFPPSDIGLYDMMGNVWEWTSTPYSAGNQTIKGGSYLCAENFCRRYRPAARQPQEAAFSASHVGFRIVRDIPDEG